MTCVKCNAADADCLTRDEQRVCETCLCEHLSDELDFSHAELRKYKEAFFDQRIQSMRAERRGFAAGLQKAIDTCRKSMQYADAELQRAKTKCGQIEANAWGIEAHTILLLLERELEAQGDD